MANIFKDIYSRIVKIEENLSKGDVSSPIDESLLKEILEKTKTFEKFIADSLEVRKVTEHIILLKMESMLEKKLEAYGPKSLIDEAQIVNMIERLLDSRLSDFLAKLDASKLEKNDPLISTEVVNCSQTLQSEADECISNVDCLEKSVPLDEKKKNKKEKKEKKTLNLE